MDTQATLLLAVVAANTSAPLAAQIAGRRERCHATAIDMGTGPASAGVLSSVDRWSTARERLWV